MNTNIKQFYTPSDWYGVYVVSIELAILATLAYLVQSGEWYVFPIVVLFFGRSQWALTDNVGHYAAHGTLFKTKKLNRALDFIYFLPMFITFKEWKETHFTHHRELGSENDPERHNFNRWKLYTNSFWNCFLLVPFRDFLRNSNYIGRIGRDKKLVLFWVAVLVCVLLFSWWKILAAWIISFFISRPYWAFLSEISEHWLVKQNHSRWMQGSRILVGWFAWFKPYGDSMHWMHHEYPAVPGYLLPLAFRVLSASEETPKGSRPVDVAAEVLS